ncbi:MAG: ABC transporter substrate-binding protein [Ilumatobacteraceae bacterium]
MRRTLPIITAALVLVTAARGSDDESTDVTSSPATADTAAADTTAGARPPLSPTARGGDGTDAAFPVTIEHKYGETTIEAEPMRVVSVGFGEHDNLLAIGVVPVAVRDWYGEQPYATWPWAQDELGDATPEVLSSTELNFEQIAALEPDLILGIASGMTDSDYATLSAIAPTVAQPADYVDYGTPGTCRSRSPAGRRVTSPRPSR